MYYDLVNSQAKKGYMGSTLGCKLLLGATRSTKSKLLRLKAKYIIEEYQRADILFLGRFHYLFFRYLKFRADSRKPKSSFLVEIHVHCRKIITSYSKKSSKERITVKS